MGFNKPVPILLPQFHGDRVVFGAIEPQVAPAKRRVYEGTMMRRIRIVVHTRAEMPTRHTHARNWNLTSLLQGVDHLDQPATKYLLFHRRQLIHGTDQKIRPMGRAFRLGASLGR